MSCPTRCGCHPMRALHSRVCPLYPGAKQGVVGLRPRCVSAPVSQTVLLLLLVCLMVRFSSHAACPRAGAWWTVLAGTTERPNHPRTQSAPALREDAEKTYNEA